MTETPGPIKASEVEPEAPNELTDEERVAMLQEFGRGYQTVPLDLLSPAKRNPRRGAVAEVIESLREFGQHRPMVVQRSTGQVIVGNHLLKALRAIGAKDGDVFLVDDDDDKAMRRALADNAVGDKAGWDEAELAEVLSEVGAVPGFEQSEVDKLLAKLAPAEVPEAPTYPLTPRLNEKYDYVILFAENETDWTWLETKMQLRREKSYKSNAVAVSHVVTVERFRELLGE